jgi:hypothetical protein
MRPPPPRSWLAASWLTALLALSPGCAAHRPFELRPVPGSASTPECTDEAKAARLTGTAVISCVITRTGEVQACIARQRVPLMTEHLMAALERSRYEPILHKGRPVTVDYIFTITLNCK